MPGLIDTHVHLGYLTQARWMLKLLLAYGATTVRDTGIRLGTLAAIRRWMEGQEAVPRMYASGRILTGGQDELKFLKEGEGTAVTVWENVAFGVQFLKTHNWVSSQALRQIARFAEQQDLYVAGHVPLSMTSIAAIDAGLKILMHTSTLRASEVLDDPELVARHPIDLPYPLRWGYWAHFDPNAGMLQRALEAWEKRQEDFFFEPTLAVLEGVASNNDPGIRDKPELQRLVSPLWQQFWRQAPIATWGSDLTEEQIAEAKAAVAGMVAFAGLAHARGIRLVTGSDTGGSPPWVVPGASLHRELELLVEGGLSAVEAVRCSTGVAAEALRAPDRGTIVSGKLADLLIVRGDVAANTAPPERSSR
ncbi:MAG: amidohydrolase family protein [Acidobacteriota bacterium]